jgi:hypothetical protein
LTCSLEIGSRALLFSHQIAHCSITLAKSFTRCDPTFLEDQNVTAKNDEARLDEIVRETNPLFWD